MSDKRGLVCVFCGEGFGYAGDTPDEMILRTAIHHEKECPKNPYLAEIATLQRKNKRLHTALKNLFMRGLVIGETSQFYIDAKAALEHE